MNSLMVHSFPLAFRGYQLEQVLPKEIAQEPSVQSALQRSRSKPMFDRLAMLGMTTRSLNKNHRRVMQTRPTRIKSVQNIPETSRTI
jgi:hypothetical protein